MGSEEPTEQSIMRRRFGRASAVKSYLRTRQSPSPRGEVHRPGLHPTESQVDGAAVSGFLPQSNSVPSTHMRCRITAILRANAMTAFL